MLVTKPLDLPTNATLQVVVVVLAMVDDTLPLPKNALNVKLHKYGYTALTCYHHFNLSHQFDNANHLIAAIGHEHDFPS